MLWLLPLFPPVISSPVVRPVPAALVVVPAVLPVLVLVLVMLLLLLGSPIWVRLRRLRRLGLQPIQYRLRRLKDLPAVLEPLLEPPLELLQRQGFELVGLLQVQPLIYQAASYSAPGEIPSCRQNWELLLFHAQENTYAHLGLRYPTEPWAWYQAAFYTFFGDRSLLLTLNHEAHQLMGHLPNTRIQDCYADGPAALAEQWATHRAAVADSAQSTVRVPTLVYVDALNAHYRDSLQHLWDRGDILPVPPQPDRPPLQQLHWKTALRLAWSLGIGASRFRIRRHFRLRLEGSEESEMPLTVEIPLELQVENIERMQQLETGSIEPESWGGWGLGLSLALFLLSLPLLGSGWAGLAGLDRAGLLMVTVAIALHEAGHVWAMRRSGYRGTAMVFLPFVGGLALGEKNDASLAQKIGVLLAGPLPGLILGLALLLGLHGFEAWLHGLDLLKVTPLLKMTPLLKQFAAVLIGLNGFNLLPIYPLDGGQIVRLLVLSLHPYLETALRVLAIALLLLLGGLALGTGSIAAVLLVVGAALNLVWTLPRSLRLGWIQRQLSQALSPPESAAQMPVANAALAQSQPDPSPSPFDPQLLHHICRLLQVAQGSWGQPGSRRVSFAQRYALVQTVLERYPDASAAGSLRWGLALVYGGCLLLPLLGCCGGWWFCGIL